MGSDRTPGRALLVGRTRNESSVLPNYKCPIAATVRTGSCLLDQKLSSRRTLAVDTSFIRAATAVYSSQSWQASSITMRTQKGLLTCKYELDTDYPNLQKHLNERQIPHPTHQIPFNQLTPLTTIIVMSLNIILVENKTSHLNTLSPFFILSPRKFKSRVRHSLRSLLILRITLHSSTIVEALDQQDLLGRLMVLVEPLVLVVVLHGQSLSVACLVDETDRDEVFFTDGLGLGNGERVPTDGLDGSPDVDDLDAAFDEFF